MLKLDKDKLVFAPELVQNLILLSVNLNRPLLLISWPIRITLVELAP